MSRRTLRGLAGPAVREFALVLAGFVAVNALALGSLRSRPDWRLSSGSVEERKYARCRQEGLDYDLVFLGTSRVHRGFDPQAFDDRCAELGQPLRSFNFGLVGMGYLEAFQVASWIVAQRSPRLRLLLVDPSDRDTDVEYYSWSTLRDVQWHDLETTERGIELAWRHADPAKRWRLTALHAKSALWRACNLGVGANLLGRFLDGSPPEPLAAEGFGTFDLPRPQRETPEERVNPGLPPPRTPAPWETMQAIETRARTAGLEVLFVIPPTGRPLHRFTGAHDAGYLSELLTFTEDDLPELFEDSQYFHDSGHLSLAGARLFSRRLAEVVARRAADR